MRKQFWDMNKNGISIVHKSITLINESIENSECFSCSNYVNIDDERLPKHFKCKRFFELIEFPNSINSIYFDEDSKCIWYNKLV